MGRPHSHHGDQNILCHQLFEFCSATAQNVSPKVSPHAGSCVSCVGRVNTQLSTALALFLTLDILHPNRPCMRRRPRCWLTAWRTSPARSSSSCPSRHPMVRSRCHRSTPTCMGTNHTAWGGSTPVRNTCTICSLSPLYLLRVTHIRFSSIY